VQYLRTKAKEEIKLHINEKLPEEYQQCLTGISQVLKIAWDIANKLPQDNRLKLQALSLANDCYKYKMDLLTNASVLSDAIKFVENSRDKLEVVSHDTILEERRDDNITEKNNKNDIQGSSEDTTRNNLISTRTTNQTF
jgi:Sec7-like guanine-nucleotide exchange factor